MQRGRTNYLDKLFHLLDSQYFINENDSKQKQKSFDVVRQGGENVDKPKTRPMRLRSLQFVMFLDLETVH